MGTTNAAFGSFEYFFFLVFHYTFIEVRINNIWSEFDNF